MYYTVLNTITVYRTDTPMAHHKLEPTSPNQAKCINALPSNERNKRSPLVVSKRNMPILGFPPGLNFSQITIDISRQMIVVKNIAVGVVHAIHERFIANAS